MDLFPKRAYVLQNIITHISRTASYVKSFRKLPLNGDTKIIKLPSGNLSKVVSSLHREVVE